MKRIIMFILVSIILVGCSIERESPEEREKLKAKEQETIEQTDGLEEGYEVEEVIELTAQEQMLEDITDLFADDLAFDTGSYVKGDIPKGEYAFVTFEGSGQYYSEKDAGGNIIDNENFDSFGYVEVHEAGNIETSGVLVKVDALDELEVSGAKELYETLNNTEEYMDSGWYKVGVDIDPGEYVIESFGDGYVAVMTGPVGNNEIINNENFNGRYSVNVQEGQYLVISRGTISN
ncbi:hypothetical protein D5F11_011380 [Siminovitchia terrae]|uniref:Uncharacterized protein n=1 Tax=Siminovitchia terrae TaxID=1914933 RepID=A0A429X8J8_SIMTE|nr:hypothetical protein [Siminovitchia terrae]RST59696.1 hypothetical protein D5F11_011380 [Siminovitchia terrae]